MTTVNESGIATGDGAITNQESQHSNVAGFREAIGNCDVQKLESILSLDKTLWDTPFAFTLRENKAQTVLQIPPLTLMTAKKKLSIVQLLLKHGAPVNTEIQTIGGTALHMAARMGAFDIAKILLDFHASIDQQDGSGSTPLHLATLYACFHFVDLLLDHDADPKLTDNEGCTPFHRAAVSGKLESLKVLWTRGPKSQIFDRNIYSNQALHVAVINDRPTVIPWLISIGADVLEPGQGGLNAFHRACAEGKVGAAEAILNNCQGHVVHEPNNHKLTPLLLACLNSKPAIVDLLLNRGASTLDTDNDLNTCYHYVIMSKHALSPDQSWILNRLHGAGADVDQCNRSGFSPLVFACRLGKTGLIQNLLDLGADINLKKAYTVLMEASSLESSDAIKILLKANPDTTVKNRHGLTALALACRFGRVENLRELIKENADVTARTRQGFTPLRVAAVHGHIEAALELLQTKDYYNPKNPLLTEAPNEEDVGLGVIEKALLSGFDTMEKVMLSSLDYVMFWAVRTGRMDLTMRCIARKMEILRVQSQSFNWLHVAANYGHANIIECLAPHFDVSQKTKHGATALHLAVTGGFLVASQTLLMLAQRKKRNALARVDAILETDSSGDCPLSLCFKRRSAEHRAIAEGFWNILNSLGADQVQLLSSNQGRALWILEMLARYEKPGREKVLTYFLERCNSTLLPHLRLPSPPPQTALEWAVFHRKVVVVWWLLSKGGYGSPHVREKAIRIISPPGSETESVIMDLLQSTPPLLEHVDNPNDDCPPALPDSNDCDASDLEAEVNIVDIYSLGKGLKALHGKGTIEKTIYGKTGGPNAVMRDNPHSLGLRDLAALKARLGRDQAHVLSPGSGTQEAQNDLKGPSDDLRIRWVHLPMNKLHLMRDLVTRLSHDSNKSEMDHNILMEHLNETWTEIPAGGGKFYMKPRCERATTRHSDKKKESPHEEEAMYTRPTTIYMPYITTGEKPQQPNRNLKSNTINRVEEPTHKPINTRNWERVTHTPITLDQYYYPVLDNTTWRDNDQVLSRYLETKNAKISDRILTIGHLWVWIIDEKTIITAADEMDMIRIMKPPQGGPPVGFFENVLRSIRNGQAGTRFSMPTTVHSMMELMLAIATSFFMAECVSVGEPLMSPIDVFRQSIKSVVNRETNLFEKFMVADLKKEGSDSSQPETWLKRLFTVYQIPANPDRAISSEAELLDEMRDIRDELCMLKALAEHQEVVWKQAFETEELRGCFKYYHPYTPTDIKQDLAGLVVEADIETNSINTLLDLRTKQASIKDAEYSRIQANDDARQSKSVFIFTIVTVIFLPLSFLSSLFALDITSFPHESGDVKYKPGWIFPIIFGATAVVCIPILIFVWNVNTFSRQTRRIDKTTAVSETKVIRSEGSIRSSFHRRSAERPPTGSKSV